MYKYSKQAEYFFFCSRAVTIVPFIVRIMLLFAHWLLIFLSFSLSLSMPVEWNKLIDPKKWWLLHCLMLIVYISMRYHFNRFQHRQTSEKCLSRYLLRMAQSLYLFVAPVSQLMYKSMSTAMLSIHLSIRISTKCTCELHTQTCSHTHTNMHSRGLKTQQKPNRMKS